MTTTDTNETDATRSTPADAKPLAPVADTEVEAATSADLAERLTAAEAESKRLKDEWLRALAEVENTRRRAARERESAGKYAISTFARDLLPVADNLSRALESVETAVPQESGPVANLVQGLELTARTLRDVLARFGITPIEALGKRFDPHVHEAMFEIPDETVPNGTVLQVIEQGYMIHDRPLRPARVGVSRGGPKAQAVPADGAGAEPEAQRPAAGPASAYGRQGEPQPESAGSHVDEKL